MSAPVKSEKKTAAPSASDYRIPASSSWANAWKIAAAFGVVGLAASAYAWKTEGTRFAFSYLFALFLVLTVALGALFFILVERLTAASWSVSVRRTAEFFAMGFPVFLVLIVPVILCRSTLYPWVRAAGGEHGLESSAHAQEPAPPAGQGAPPSGRPGLPPSPHGGPPTFTPPAGNRLPPGFHPPSEGATGRPARRPDAKGERGEKGEAVAGPEEAQEAEVIAGKRPWLNETSWGLRAALYVVAWCVIAFLFTRYSTGQDTTKDPKLTVKAQSLAPAATFIFAFTLTGAAFDWLMSLLPTWYSTIYGVTIFAGSVVVIYATLILVTMSLRESGLLKDAINVEHYHDLGKLLFGFLVFWAYVSFAQFMLIWYAAIPDEVTFYHHRWDVGPWMNVSLAIVVLHFVVPFFILLSRNVKRRLWALRIGALWLVGMHVVEMYWQVMPYFGDGEIAGSWWIDAACLVGVAGAYLAFVFYQMTKFPLIPIGDPRLSRSLTFENA